MAVRAAQPADAGGIAEADGYAEHVEANVGMAFELDLALGTGPEGCLSPGCLVGTCTFLEEPSEFHVVDGLVAGILDVREDQA